MAVELRTPYEQALMDDKSKATAKWGAACAACASAKAKCIRSIDGPGVKCDRCERLFKDCTGQVHRPRKKRTSKTSKTAQLEERLNGLVDLLRASGELNTTLNPPADTSPYAASTDRSRDPTSDASPHTSPRDGRREQPSPAAAPWMPQATIPASYNSFAPPTCICRPETGEVVTAAVDSDEELLAKYRAHAFPHYPFVAVAPGTTAEQLVAERPILMMAIRTVASVDNSRYMQGAMYRLICLIADRVVLRSERSLDLVLAILVIIGWYQYHCMMHAQLNNLLYLGISMMADLGLSRPPRLAERTQIMVLHPNVPSPRTNEERRLVLGFWYMSSCLSLGFLKIETLRFSPYIRQCLEELHDAPEYPSDAYLVAIIRLQHLAEKIAKMNKPEELVDEIPGIPRAPMAAYQLAFQDELDRLCQSMPEDVKSDKLIENHIATIKLRLYEPPLIDVSLLQKFTSDFTAVSPNSSSGLDILYRSHNALVEWFDQWFSIPVPQYHWVPVPLCVQLVYGITMLSRWARLVGLVRPAQHDARDPNGNAPTAAVVSSSSSPSIVKDPSHRLVPGQGVPASLPSAVTAGATSSSSSFPLYAAHPVYPACSAFAGFDIKEISRDPKLKAALSQMRTTLRNQPGLLIDIAGLLNAMGDRFDQSNLDMRTASAAKYGDSVGRGMNIWDLTSRKIAILRSKLSRFLDESNSIETGAHQQQQQQQQQYQQQTQRESRTHQQHQQHHQQQYQQQQQQQQQQHHQQQSPQQNSTPIFAIPQGSFPVDPNLGANVAGGVVGATTNGTVLPPDTMEGLDCNSQWANEMFDELDASLWLENLPWVSG